MHTPNHIRCLDCQYNLADLRDHQCPECGRAFDLMNYDTFDSRPPFVYWTYWMPGMLTAAMIGLICFIGLYTLNSSGWAIWIGVPVVMGTGLGIYCRVSRVLLVTLAVFVIGGVITSLGIMNFAGLFCALILFFVTLIPIGVGLFLGTWLRLRLKDHDPLFCAYLPAILLILTPFALHFAGFSGKAHTTELAVTTSRIVIGTPEDVWETLMFFEDVGTTPPLLMRLALPRPLYSTGSMKQVGDRRVCVYTKGKLAKEIVKISENETLVFRIIEQEFEPSVRLTSGQFLLEPMGNRRTKISLTTKYIPVHSPRFAWRWAEIAGAQTLHMHVINGIESQIFLKDMAVAAEP